MKKPRDIPELASRLSNAANTPLVPSFQPVSPEAQERPRKAPSRGSKTVFLRVPPELFQRFDDEAVNRTRATGRGVTVQQVILDKLAGQP
jgi:hypothetical protein